MRVLFVVSVLATEIGGGNAERTYQLAKAMAEKGYKCTILTLRLGTHGSRAFERQGISVIRLPLVSSRFHIPVAKLGRISWAVRNNDVIHIMGYWSLLAVFVSMLARLFNVPYVLCPGGALLPFGRSKIIKRLFHLLLGRKMLLEASGWIAVTQREISDFVSFGISPSAIKVIPNGVDTRGQIGSSQFASQGLVRTSRPYILFMGRLNYIKGVDLLLEAFSTVADQFPEIDLIFAGEDEGMRSTMNDFAKLSGIQTRISYTGFVSGEAKLSLYRDALLLVVPSRREAMSIVAVEAGILGTPVLMTDQCGLDELSSVSAALVVTATAKGIAQGLAFALSDEIRLRKYGVHWQSIVREKFIWTNIADDLLTYFRRIRKI